jgi:acetyl-CoA C-acetyltransferase
MNKMKKRVAITSAARTAVGNLNGSLKTVPAEQLFSAVLRACLERSGNVDPLEIDSIQCGQVLQQMTCNNPAKWCAMDIGAKNAHGMTTNRICGSGYQAMVSAWHEIQTGHADIVLAGGTENMTRSNFFFPSEFRYKGFGQNDQVFYDPMKESHMGSQPAHIGPPEWMGVTGDRVAKMYNISREDCDRYSYETQMKNKIANEQGKFVKEIVPIEVDLGRKLGKFIFDKDEFGKPNTTMEALAKLKPAFGPDGVVTAGGATGFNDGAAAVLMMSEETAEKKGLEPMAFMVDYAIGVCDPLIMGVAPAYGIPKLMKQQNLTFEDVDLIEINEPLPHRCWGA